MFSRKSCYFFVRPKKSFLEVCIFLGRTLKSPRIRRAVRASKSKVAHLIQVRHRDEVEPPLTDWLREAYRSPGHTDEASEEQSEDDEEDRIEEGREANMTITFVLLAALALQSSPPAQEPRRVTPDQTETKPAYREVQKGEEQVEGLLQRVVCPTSGPIRFMIKVKDRAEPFEAPRLGDVDYIAHTPDFKGPMTCGGRGAGDRVLVTWKKAGTGRRVIAIEFLPKVGGPEARSARLIATL